MFAVLPLILAAGSFPSLIYGAPVPFILSSGDAVELASIHSLQEERRSTYQYTVFGGTGEVSNGWPSMSDWVSDFETMFNNNKATMQASCTQFGVADNSDSEISDMYNNINSVASSSGIDARFIFAIIMQESNGCVRAPTTNYGVRNPGLMQSHNGAGTCNDASVSNPCPTSEIKQMIEDGTMGTSSGDGLVQCLADTGASDVSMYYKAARIYNSGSMPASGNLGQGGATACYVSDITNRLLGWASGTSDCAAGVVATLMQSTFVSSGSESGIGNAAAAESSTVSVAAAPPSTATASAAANTATGGVFLALPAATTSTATVEPLPTAMPTTNPTTTTVAAPAATTSSTAPPSIGSPSSTAPYGTYPGAVSGCKQYYTVMSGDNCWVVDQEYGISLDQLRSWNSGLDAGCSNLWLGYSYCVSA